MRPFKTGICVFAIGGLWAAGISVYAQAPAGPMTQTTSPTTGIFPREYGEQRQSADGRRSEDEEFERIVEVEQRRKHAAKEKR